MDFGFWRYLFAKPQFAAAGKTLLQVLPAKPRSSASMQYNNTFIFNELGKVNQLRNRIAHHEPICFKPRFPLIDTSYVREHYALLRDLFSWMEIDVTSFLYGVDHVLATAQKVDRL